MGYGTISDFGYSYGGSGCSVLASDWIEGTFVRNTCSFWKVLGVRAYWGV